MCYGLGKFDFWNIRSVRRFYFGIYVVLDDSILEYT